jgi:hypothetical protein
MRVKKDLYNFIASELEARLQSVRYKIRENKRSINDISKRQAELKREASEAYRMLAEFRKAGK